MKKIILIIALLISTISFAQGYKRAAVSTPLTTKGDLFTFSTVDTRLPIGTNGYMLIANSSQPTGLEYVLPTTDHTLFQNIGVNTHAVIDTHIATGTIHYLQSAISIPALQITDFDTEVSNNTSVNANSLFRVTPSTIITAGTNLSWAGNTLNAAGGGSQDLNSVLGVGNSSALDIDLNGTTSVFKTTASATNDYASLNPTSLLISNSAITDYSWLFADKLQFKDVAGVTEYRQDYIHYQIGGSSYTINYPATLGGTRTVNWPDGSGTVAFTSDITGGTTNLTEGTSTTTTVDVNSDTGTNATLQPASTLRAGVMSKAKFDEVVVNNAKVTNASHTGDVTGSTALTIATDAVDIPMLSATGTPSASTYLRGDNTWATPAGGSQDLDGVLGVGNISDLNLIIQNGAATAIATHGQTFLKVDDVTNSISSTILKDVIDFEKNGFIGGVVAPNWTGNRVLTLPDKTGTFAVLSDITTNLSTTHNPTTVVVNSDTGTNATINAATASLAGIVTNATQIFAGAKTFNDNVIINNDLSQLRVQNLANNRYSILERNYLALFNGIDNNQIDLNVGTPTINVGLTENSITTSLQVSATSNRTLTFPDKTDTLAVLGDLVTEIDDLTDGITGGNSIFLGAGAGANDDLVLNQNIGLGINALNTNTTGIDNVGIGYNSLRFNTVGNANTAIGWASLSSNITGGTNTAIGSGSMGANTSGINNVGIGANTFSAIPDGDNNIGIGTSAGDNMTAGSNNILIGYDIDAQSGTGSNQLSIGNLIFATGGFGTAATVGTGNVGIKNTSPGYALDVTGDINTSGDIRKSGTVYTHPDYVFDKYFDGFSKDNKSYKMLTLEEIEIFINKNRHLPNVQSKKTIKETGSWIVTKSVTTNLEKIEELYLHAIELNKELILKDKKIKEMELRMVKIEKILNNIYK